MTTQRPDHHQVAATHDGLARIRAEVQRSEVAAIGDDAATERDRAAELRDGAARRADVALLASDPGNRALRAVVATNTELREQVLEDRRRAAADRTRASDDRLSAAAGQRSARIDIRRTQRDAGSGVYARELGLSTLRGEIGRCRRNHDPLVLALVRVDALARLRERQSSAQRDALVRSVVVVLRDQLRSSDPLVRVAANEFLCVLPGSPEDRAHERVDDIRMTIQRMHPRAAVSVGLATLTPQDTLDALIDRASADLPAT